jgi:pimeloyl-ACP methyl ester carboxylesterase
MPTFTRYKLTLYYELDGQGAPMLLVPGLASDSQSWAPVRSDLASSFRLILPDPRSTGRTTPLSVSCDVDSVVGDLIGLLDHLEVAQVALVGHSFGGIVAHRLAIKHPERVRCAVLAGAGRLSTATTAALSDLVAARDEGLSTEHWYRLFFHWLFRPETTANAAWMAGAARLAAHYPYAQPSECLKRQLAAAVEAVPEGVLACPTLLLCGEHDRLVSSAETRSSFVGTDVTASVLPGTAHSMHWDDPEAFCATVRHFVMTHSVDSGSAQAH